MAKRTLCLGGGNEPRPLSNYHSNSHSFKDDNLYDFFVGTDSLKNRNKDEILNIYNKCLQEDFVLYREDEDYISKMYH
ncbi:hypothetical protein HHI36_004189, partial [Cryptolaemus montrouzieri]